MKRFYGHADEFSVEYSREHGILTIVCPAGTQVTATDHQDGFTPTVVNIFTKA